MNLGGQRGTCCLMYFVILSDTSAMMFFLSSENASYGSVSCKFVGHNVMCLNVGHFIKFIYAFH